MGLNRWDIFKNLYLEYKNLIDKKITNIKYLLDLFGNYAPSDVYENVYNTLYPLVNAKTYEEYNLCKTISLPKTTKLDEDSKKVKEELSKEIKSFANFIIYDDFSIFYPSRLPLSRSLWSQFYH